MPTSRRAPACRYGRPPPTSSIPSAADAEVCNAVAPAGRSVQYTQARVCRRRTTATVPPGMRERRHAHAAFNAGVGSFRLPSGGGATVCAFGDAWLRWLLAHCNMRLRSPSVSTTAPQTSHTSTHGVQGTPLCVQLACSMPMIRGGRGSLPQRCQHPGRIVGGGTIPLKYFLHCTVNQKNRNQSRTIYYFNIYGACEHWQ